MWSDKLFNKALEINPKFLNSILLLARAYEQKEELDSAIEILEKGKADYPKNSSIHYYLGRIYFKKANNAKSISSFEECTSIFCLHYIDIDNNHLGACLYLATIMANDGNAQNTLKYFKHALAIDSNNINANFVCGKEEN